MGHEAKTEVPGARGDGKMSKVPLKKLDRTSKAKHFRKNHFDSGRGESVSKEICGTVRLYLTSRLASVTFKMASKVFFEETHKNFDFIAEIPF